MGSRHHAQDQPRVNDSVLSRGAAAPDVGWRLEPEVCVMVAAQNGSHTTRHQATVESGS